MKPSYSEGALWDQVVKVKKGSVVPQVSLHRKKNTENPSFFFLSSEIKTTQSSLL
jgi:hypothetical protein